MENSLKVHEEGNKKKLLKYLLYGLVISTAARYIPTYKMDNKEILTIGATGSIIYAIVDMISPSIKI
jgi:hypothetical protein